MLRQDIAHQNNANNCMQFIIKFQVIFENISKRIIHAKDERIKRLPTIFIWRKRSQEYFLRNFRLEWNIKY